MHDGIARDGTRLYPAMPYASYTYMTDRRCACDQGVPGSVCNGRGAAADHTLSFPFNQRWLSGMVSAFFNSGKRLEPNSERSASGIVGAYLAEAMALVASAIRHGASRFALVTGRKFAGEKQAGWVATTFYRQRNGIGDGRLRRSHTMSARGMPRGAAQPTADGRSSRA